MMAKLLLYSDLHFYDNGNDRLKVQVDTCTWIANMVSKTKPDYVVNCGDTNDRHEVMSVSAIHAMGKGIGAINDAAKEVGASHIILMGNHDQYRRDGSVSIAPVLRFSDNTIVVESEWVGGSIAALAYHKSLDEFNERLDFIIKRNRAKLKILLLHQPIQNAYHRPGIPDLHGSEYKPLSGLTAFCGHYHHPQMMEAFGSPYLFIVGSPCYYGWSDTINDNPRGILLFNTENGKWKRVENPHGPLYHTVETLKELTDYKSVGKRLHVRILARTQRTFDRASELLEDLEKVFLSVSVVDHRDVQAIEERTIVDASGINPEDLVRDIVASNSGELNPDLLCKEGLDIINSVRK